MLWADGGLTWYSVAACVQSWEQLPQLHLALKPEPPCGAPQRWPQLIVGEVENVMALLWTELEWKLLLGVHVFSDQALCLMESLIHSSMIKSVDSVQSHAGAKLLLHPLLSIFQHTLPQKETEAWMICGSFLFHLEMMSNIYTQRRLLPHDLLQVQLTWLRT